MAVSGVGFRIGSSLLTPENMKELGLLLKRDEDGKLIARALESYLAECNYQSRRRTRLGGTTAEERKEVRARHKAYWVQEYSKTQTLLDRMK